MYYHYWKRAMCKDCKHLRMIDRETGLSPEETASKHGKSLYEYYGFSFWYIVEGYDQIALSCAVNSSKFTGKIRVGRKCESFEKKGET